MTVTTPDMRFAINLLSPKKQRVLRASVIVSAAQGILVSFLAFSIVVAVTLVSLRFVLAGAERDLASQSARSSADAGSPETEVRAIDAYLKRLDQAHRNHIRWSDALDAVAVATPPGVRLTRFDVARDGAVTLRGMAATREDVLLYEEALRSSGVFMNLSAPLSNLLQRTDAAFEFTATYVPQAANHL